VRETHWKKRAIIAALKGLNVSMIIFSPFRAVVEKGALPPHFVRGYSNLVPSGQRKRHPDRY
jgi:hypothetical protein